MWGGGGCWGGGGSCVGVGGRGIQSVMLRELRRRRAYLGPKKACCA